MNIYRRAPEAATGMPVRETESRIPLRACLLCVAGASQGVSADILEASQMIFPHNR